MHQTAHAEPAAAAHAQMPISDVDVCTIGAGPVGGTLACHLAQAGIKVAAVDKADLPAMEAPDFDGRAYAIAAGPKAHLDEAGVGEALPLPSRPLADIP